MTRKTKMHELRDYIIIGLAMIEGSIGLNLFLLPNHITMGGVGGIALSSVGDLAFLLGHLSGAQRIFAVDCIPYPGLEILCQDDLWCSNLCCGDSLHRDSYGRYDSFASRSAFYGDSHRCLLYGKQCWIGSWM